MRPVLSIFVAVMLMLPMPAAAYLGPVLGLGVIGSVLAIVVVGFLSGFSFIYLPIRNWLDRNRKRRDGDADRQD